MSNLKNIATGSLKSKLIELIRLRGPLSVTEYMKIVLTNPENGFYMNKDVFGVKGHFTTNPEISQTFGEVLAAWILQEWRRFQCPKPLHLVEFGPGRGTLMSDIARTLNKFEQARGSFNIEMVELSPKLKEIQQETLKQHSNLVDKVKWHNHVEEVSKNEEGFTAFVAHEFLDALPIYKFVKDPQGRQWRELLIDYDKDLNLRFGIAKQPSLSARLLIPKDFQGEHIEVCPDSSILMQKVATRLEKSSKGCMLVCDYGFEDEPEAQEFDQKRVPSLKPIRANRDTFRAFKNHQPWPPLSDPGEADLTADVDFGYLKQQLAGKALIFGSTTQKQFLTQCGLQARVHSLLQHASDEQEREILKSSAQMMLEDMGERYRFLAMFPKNSEHLFKNDPPAGFSVEVGGEN